jgi:murein DD-endopeptidase MepM/ murein hydrolase activator NlpD
MRFSYFFMFLALFAKAQNHYPKDYFRLPLDIPMRLAGNFGELRSNHFHSGLDFKTNQVEGLNVYAVADGYVSRIKISTFGYGTAIYINHPNGYTSVYGHLKIALGDIGSYIKNAQYQSKSFEIQLFPKANELKVTKGQVIALSGNTGGSSGPHLHFEIRNTATEFIINPLFFGFDDSLTDTKKPEIKNLYVYPVNHAVVNGSKIPIALNLSLQKDGSYMAQTVSSNGAIGFGIVAEDYDNVSWARNGVYKVQTYLNGSPSFGYEMETFSFDESRYINALIDYSKYKKTGQRVQKLFMKMPYNLSTIKTTDSNGIVTVKPNLNYVYRIEASDFMGNIQIINIPIKYNQTTPLINKEETIGKYYVKAGRESNFEKDNWAVYFPKGCFYEDFNLNFDVQNDVLNVQDSFTPAHKSFKITTTNSSIPERDKDKVYFSEVHKGNRDYNDTKRQGDTYTAWTKTLGKYALTKDTTPPKISIKSTIEGKVIDNHRYITLYIYDNESGIDTYNGYINGKWALFTYDYKSKKIRHDLNDGIYEKGNNTLKVIITDKVGNKTNFETHFIRN